MHKMRTLVLFGFCLVWLSACSTATPAPMPAPATQAAAQPAAQAAATVAPAAIAAAEPDLCSDCHTDQARLSASAAPGTDTWKKVLVDGVNFTKTVHGQIPCANCHGGVQSTEKKDAHAGVVPNPSREPQGTCGKCHPDIVANAAKSLHTSLDGFVTQVEKRSLPNAHPEIEKAIGQQCQGCHVTCGDCHITQPAILGNGLANGHNFNRKPAMIQTCVACHGSRAGNEYLGKNQGLPADVHYAQGNMECADCHSEAQMHGQPTDCQTCHKGPVSSQVMPKDHRYGGVQSPRCESCHPKVSAGQDDIMFHQMHGANLSCQVCHSVAYTSCEGCHTETDPKTGKPKYTLAGQTTTFLIGLNPIQTYERPYRYVPVRHVPVTPDLFAAYGKDLLAEFIKQPTWTYATPHNIQRRTPQTETCNACHGNAAIFLTADKLSGIELQANQSVIVPTIPLPVGGGLQIPDK